MSSSDPNIPEAAIAIVGMACRYAGARSIHQFWENLRNGVASITEFTLDELEDDPRRIADPNYVPKRSVVEDADLFDAPLFGLTPKEAGIMDPQQRLFLQICLECLEDGGYDPEAAGQTIGLFGGSDPSTYELDIRIRPNLNKKLDHLEILIGNGPGFFTTRASYLLNLRGPSVTVQTTCSTSLTAIHLACQSLLGFECDMALAGGASVPSPLKAGHIYVPDGPLSPDGYCRTFDHRAAGTAMGSGAGAVLLKRLEDAMADGDHIYAVIRGSAFNNDGSAKVGYTAPSVEGQRRVISEAMEVAGVTPDEVSFIETHGTATKLGDPIEVEALRQAFGPLAPGSCYLGAVKTNIGHTNAAAGVAGLIKTALCIANRTLVPNLHFEKPNPELDLESSPFTIPTTTMAWEKDALIAGVSAFGLGGTNVHAILTEAPPATETNPAEGPYLLTLSAKSESALVRKRLALQENLRNHPPTSLADWTFTLNVGRKDWDIRQSFAFDTAEEAIAALDRKRALKPANTSNQVVFLFPGQGSAYKDFGKQLYQESAVYRETVNACADILQADLGLNLPDLMFSNAPEDLAKLQQAQFWQPAIFVCEYALAQHWMHLGITPRAMQGHSIGEYVAATLAGVFSLKNALNLIALRGRETAKHTGGSMIAVIADRTAVQPFLNDAIELAAENGPSLQILAGPDAAIQALNRELKEQGLQTIALPTEHAFHTQMMAPVATRLRELLQQLPLHAPKIPIISNVTGAWLTDEQACDPGYWAKHTRGTVRFSPGLETLFQNPHQVFLEVGPGKVLTKLVSRHPDGKFGAIASCNHDEALSQVSLLQAMGQLWEQGVALDWKHFYRDQNCQRLSLPTYPFDGVRYWILDEDNGLSAYASDPLQERKDPQDWFYQPTWRQAEFLTAPVSEPDARWVIFAEEGSLGDQLASRLEALHQQVVRVHSANSFQKFSDSSFALPFSDHQAYGKLLQNLILNDKLPSKAVFEPGLPKQGEPSTHWDQALSGSFDAAMHWAQAMQTQAHEQSQSLYFLTHRLLDFGKSAPLQPVEGTLVGAAWIISKEMPQLQCHLVDVDPHEPTEDILASLVPEVSQQQSPDQVALRCQTRWEPQYQPIHLPDEPQTWPERPLLVIANGLQPFGLELARHFTLQHRASVVLLDRSFFPAEQEWDEWIREQGSQDPISRAIETLRAIKQSNGSVQIRQSVLDQSERLNKTLEAIESELGSITGYLHLESPQEAGLILLKAALAVSRLLQARLREAKALSELSIRPQWLLLFTENLAESGIGRSEQAGLHTFLAHFARNLRKLGIPATAIEWGTTQWDPEALSETAPSAVSKQLAEKRQRFGMSIEECAQAIAQITSVQTPRIIVSTRDFDAVLDQQRHFTAKSFQEKTGAAESLGFHARPELSTQLVLPRNEVEKLMAEVWQSYFDIDAIGVDDNFFELGGHSLLAVQLLAKINDTFAGKLTMQALFDTPTISGLSAALTQNEANEETEDLAALLDEIEGLSEEDLKLLLEAETAS